MEAENTEDTAMEEKIYTIPVTEAFEKKDGCPFCRLRRELEETERDLVMGASMMEPDVRIQTNEHGFCAKHYGMMLEKGNRLSLALILESHIGKQRDAVALRGKGLLGGDRSDKAASHIKALTNDCYICRRVDEKYEKMVSTAVLLWARETSFRELVASTPYFCLPHAAMYIEASKRMDKRVRADFIKALDAVQNRYLDSLGEDVSWFCKKFDYRYDAEPWGNAKDAPERAIRFLAGDC